MRIWFDLSNSPHINIFLRVIRDLEREHEVVITSRPLANTLDMLELHGLEHTVVGRHYGASRVRKTLGFPVRVIELYRFLRRQRIDVAVAHASFYSPVVARLLRTPSLFMNDNEHALGNLPAFTLADTVLVPEYMTLAHARRMGARARKVVHYPGVKEGLYLWCIADAFRAARRAQQDRGERRPRVYVRPEPWAAHYYHGAVNFMDDLLVEIGRDVDVTVLARGAAQGAHYRDARFGGLRVLELAIDLLEIAPDCDLFIGAGGTMTREMAVLGVPTISVYRAELLDVDRYLVATGRLRHEPDLDAAGALQALREGRQQAVSTELLDKGRAAHALLERHILALAGGHGVAAAHA